MDLNTILLLIIIISLTVVFAKEVYDEYVEPICYRFFRRSRKNLDSSVRYISYTDICIELFDNDYIHTKLIAGRVFLEIPAKTSNVNYILIEFKKSHIDALKYLTRKIELSE
ncbi:MAG: hypothetical protein F6K48_32325 [Okeania sp. SIO3H1]|uniref:hypothetical protein n=1 Tax=Okeania sp. SIO1I7 TaxID=2607772 RepID=UPI0013C99AA0|nr:hypothetical protein [Okeania sp. SIO1I7]NEN93319.1 hypothetical protein [Okeania sp. SIO3H1]NET30205.1 hypothetical protein [Okeania sp. SIO1I7]